MIRWKVFSCLFVFFVFSVDCRLSKNFPANFCFFSFLLLNVKKFYMILWDNSLKQRKKNRCSSLFRIFDLRSQKFFLSYENFFAPEKFLKKNENDATDAGCFRILAAKKRRISWKFEEEKKFHLSAGPIPSLDPRIHPLWIFFKTFQDFLRFDWRKAKDPVRILIRIESNEIDLVWKLKRSKKKIRLQSQNDAFFALLPLFECIIIW